MIERVGDVPGEVADCCVVWASVVPDELDGGGVLWFPVPEVEVCEAGDVIAFKTGCRRPACDVAGFCVVVPVTLSPSDVAVRLIPLDVCNASLLTLVDVVIGSRWVVESVDVADSEYCFVLPLDIVLEDEAPVSPSWRLSPPVSILLNPSRNV